MLEQKNYCSLSWEPLRDLKWVVLFVFPQVHLRRSTLVRTLGGMWVGRPVRVAGGELIVADVRRHHDPLHDHHVHRDVVVLDGQDTLGPLRGAPVLIQEGSHLSLRSLTH